MGLTLLNASIIYMNICIWAIIIYRSTEEVVTHCLHQGEDAEARSEVSHQGAGSLQGLCLLRLDFTQECL